MTTSGPPNGTLLLGIFLAFALAACGASAAPTPAPTTAAPSVTPLPTLAATSIPSPTSTPIPGIGAPLCVDGVEVTFSFAKKQFFYDEILASSPQDMLLVISGAGSTGLTSINQTWLDQVSVIDENGRRDLIAFAPIIDTLANPGQFLWVLNVSKNSSKFSLHLPGDKTVDLAPLLWRLSLEASPTDDNK